MRHLQNTEDIVDQTMDLEIITLYANLTISQTTSNGFRMDLLRRHKVIRPKKHLLSFYKKLTEAVSSGVAQENKTDLMCKSH